MKKILYLFIGLALGFALGSPAAQAIEGIFAQRCTSPILLNGAPVEIEAYNINGHNYFKLRDIGKKQDIVDRTNALRKENGIAALTANDKLMQAAQVRADEMAANTVYSHTRPDGRKYTTVTDCKYVGENIHQIPLLYLEQQKGELAETVVHSWSKSAGHMENMINASYASIGVGLARGIDGNGLECWYCVQLFLRDGYHITWVDTPAKG